MDEVIQERERERERERESIRSSTWGKMLGTLQKRQSKLECLGGGEQGTKNARDKGYQDKSVPKTKACQYKISQREERKEKKVKKE